MYSICSRWHKPKKRPTKRSRLCAEKVKNRWTQNQALQNTECLSHSNESCDETFSPVKNNSENSTQSISVAKLQEFPSTPAAEENNDEKSSFVFMNNDMWSSLLANVKCDECSMNSLDVVLKGTFGFSTKIELVCKNCNKLFNSVFTSPREKESKGFEANKRLVEAFLKIGKGHAALEVFSMAIGVHAMDKKTFSKCLHKLHEEKQNFKDKILKISQSIIKKKHEEFSKNADGIVNITVSYDGTWQKRGHTSLFGIGIVIDVITGLVIDYEILSKYCAECITAKRDLGLDSDDFFIWYQGHKQECSENFIGSSNSMEMKAAEILWKRSIKTCGMRYVNIISDGDSKTHQHLSLINVYGDDVKITKEECINHVAKRLGTGLRNKVTEWRCKGVTIGGRKVGSLKEETITKLVNFYRKAIKDNVPDVQKMKSAIFASLYHCSSTDISPKHNKCPTGCESWCFYQRALANNEKAKSHTTMKTKLREDILPKILPVYQRLASDDLLARCVSGKTQNPNESLHSIIWKNCPKETFVSKKRLDFAVISSISEFNFGSVNSLNAEQELNTFSMNIAQRRDKRRIDQSQKRNSKDWKRNRVNKKIEKSLKIKQNVKKEGVTYGAGKF